MAKSRKDENNSLIECLFKLFCRYWAIIFFSITLIYSISYCLAHRNTDMIELAVFSAVVLLLSIAIGRAWKIF